MAIVLASCGPDGHHFELEGHFLKMNQGDFFVYSPDGLVEGIDTIHVMGGRFAYEIPCENEGMLVIVLPNFSEIPVFASPGKSVEISADASHIKDIEVKGTKDNELMTGWRKSIDGMSPPQQVKQAELFIRDNVKSLAAQWILRKYFVQCVRPDYKKAKELITLLQKEGRQTSALAYMAGGIENALSSQVGEALGNFTSTDLKGNSVSSADLKSGRAIVFVWASWNNDGTNIQRMLRSRKEKMQREGKKTPRIVSISLDASPTITKKHLERDSLGWTVICDGKMWDSPLVKALGITTIPDNIVIENGKVTARHLNSEDLIKEVEK